MKLILTSLVLFMSCNFASKEDPENSALKVRQTEHFTFTWNESDTTTDEIEKALVFCEEIYKKLANLIGEEKMPDDRMEVLLEGEGLRENGRKIPPNVDRQGRIHLYRFSQGGYLDAFPHELVHAVRINRVPNWERFFEEGFASAISDVIYPEKQGFPLFGYSRQKITSYLMQQDYFISLSEMKAKHREVNLRCQLQTYIPREDFFCYLRDTYGLEKLLAFSNSGRTNEYDLYEEIWGKRFTELESDWMDYTLALFAKDEVSMVGSEYFEKTSAKYIPLCK